jgi:hypothetical protein
MFYLLYLVLLNNVAFFSDHSRIGRLLCNLKHCLLFVCLFDWIHVWQVNWLPGCITGKLAVSLLVTTLVELAIALSIGSLVV